MAFVIGANPILGRPFTSVTQEIPRNEMLNEIEMNPTPIEENSSTEIRIIIALTICHFPKNSKAISSFSN